MKSCLGGSSLLAVRIDGDAQIAELVSNAAAETAPCWINDLLSIVEGLIIIQ